MKTTISTVFSKQDFLVTNINDSGTGSLRQAIINANTHSGPDIITFDDTSEVFETPQTIILDSELPELIGELSIDGRGIARLWRASGVTISGANRNRVLTVADKSKVTISAVTISDGFAVNGGGILNKGTLLIKDSTFINNHAQQLGAGLLNQGDKLTIINSTFVDNTAVTAGGGLANNAGKAVITNSTFSANRAHQGGGLFNSKKLALRNTIMANSLEGKDCINTGQMEPKSGNNLIETSENCGRPISTADPTLGKLGYYNGPAKTLPIASGSPAVNLGDNAFAVDEQGAPLRWDQRGNGDPRFVGGITDIGAFELQVFPILLVDTFEDTELRGCTNTGKEDCSLRGAINLANANKKPVIIKFHPSVFASPRIIVLNDNLPKITTDMTIDGSNTGGVKVSGNQRYTAFKGAQNIRINLKSVSAINEAP